MIKMASLVKATGESKSTILYYIKEGLLPEPKKLKPNVHLYSDEVINRIKLIKYFQINFSYSISQIKKIFDIKKFDFGNDIDILIKLLDTISGGNDNPLLYSSEEVLKHFDISEKLLAQFIRDEFLLPKKDSYNQKDLDILTILLESKKSGIDEELFKEYVKSAHKLAILEYKMASKLLKNNPKCNLNFKQKLLFDVILTLKPYIFNKQTIRQHTQKISGESYENL